MRFIEAPHIILRKALINNDRVSSFAVDVATFMAQTLFGTSALALEGGALRTQVALWSQNIEMCALTEKVIFTDPYQVHEQNRWTTPQLDSYVQGIRNDAPLKLAAAYHKTLFLTCTQALLHGDLHTGSVMVKEGSTFVIDPEFAFYGPMGFDVGAMLANLFLSYFSKSAGSDHKYADWILEQIVTLHVTFVAKFLHLWDTAAAVEGFAGEVYRNTVYSDQLLERAQNEFLAGLWRDTLGFTGSKMLRRLVGISHVEDMESIADPEVRSVCEKRALLFARQLILASYSNTAATQFATVESILTLARAVYAEEPSAEWPR